MEETEIDQTQNLYISKMSNFVYQQNLNTLRHRIEKVSYRFYFTSSQPIRPKEASDSDFTIEDVMLWPGMRFSLRSQCKRCSAGRLHRDY